MASGHRADILALSTPCYGPAAMTNDPVPTAAPRVRFRRKPFVLATLLAALALPMLVVTFVGDAGVAWSLLAVGLLLASSRIMRRERNRVREASKRLGQL